MTTIERIIALASGLGWQVTTQKKKRYLVEFEFQQYTKMGQDFNFCAVMKGNDINSLIENIEEYYEGFDPDYEAYLWIGRYGWTRQERCTLPYQGYCKRHGRSRNHDR